jgi:branched-chain amino acid transport system substrate-binding protein
VLGESFPPFNTTNYAPYFPAIRDARPDVVFANFAGTDAVAFVKQFAEFGLSKQTKVVAPSNLVSEDVLPRRARPRWNLLELVLHAVPRHPEEPLVRQGVQGAAGQGGEPFPLRGLRRRPGSDRRGARGARRRRRQGEAHPDHRGHEVRQPAGAFRFDPKTHTPIQDIHIRQVQANPVRSVVVDMLKNVAHPDNGTCKL